MDDGRQRSGRTRWLAAAGAAAAVLVLGVGAPTLAQRTKAPSFQREVAPILASRCTGCHQVGGIAPFSLETAAGAHAHAAAIGKMVASRRMPPWPPGPLSPKLVGSELRTLTAHERDVLVRWAAAGGPVDRAVRVGKPAPVADQPLPGETLRTLPMPAPYTPVSAKGATDDYHCFLLDPALDQDVFVTSARIEPGARAQVHHVIVFKVPVDQVAEAERLDALDSKPGWSCFGGTGLDLAQGGGARAAVAALDDAPWLAAWAPGAAATRLPDGLGIPLAKGSRLVMQVHYNLLNGTRPDRSTAVLTTVPATAGLRPSTSTAAPSLWPLPISCSMRERLSAVITGPISTSGSSP